MIIVFCSILFKCCKSLKELIVSGVRDAPVPDEREQIDHTLELYQKRLSEKFFMACDRELKKVNTFFAEKKAESLRHFYELSNGIRRLSRDHADQPKSLGQKLFQRNRRAMLINRYKISLSELYLHMVLLQNYQVLNHTGFRKILKKYDKVSEHQDQEQDEDEGDEELSFYM